MREKPDNIDVNTIKRAEINVSPEIRELAMILSAELNLKIFGFDLIKKPDKDRYFLIDLNDFPGFRGINGIEDVFIDFFKSFLHV